MMPPRLSAPCVKKSRLQAGVGRAQGLAEQQGHQPAWLRMPSAASMRLLRRNKAQKAGIAARPGFANAVMPCETGPEGYSTATLPPPVRALIAGLYMASAAAVGSTSGHATLPAPFVGEGLAFAIKVNEEDASVFAAFVANQAILVAGSGRSSARAQSRRAKGQPAPRC